MPRGFLKTNYLKTFLHEVDLQAACPQPKILRINDGRRVVFLAGFVYREKAGAIAI